MGIGCCEMGTWLGPFIVGRLRVVLLWRIFSDFVYFLAVGLLFLIIDRQVIGWTQHYLYIFV